MESSYDNLAAMASGVAAGNHRQLIGDMWEELGLLQFEFMKSEGLEPHHKLLDVGCGALRAGVHFVQYLNPGHYFGIDISVALLNAGYDNELSQLGLQDRLPRQNLICNGDFEIPGPHAQFDYALAQSVFTHLSFNRIRQCLTNITRVIKPGGVFYATIFELPSDAPSSQPFKHEPGGKNSYEARDPYHYRLADLRYAIRSLPWTLRHVGNWKHPRGQAMLAFVRQRELPMESPAVRAERNLSIDEAARLQAGAHHYRAYVGPPNRYDYISATQFSLLFANGLRDHHRVLDFGAGSLRLGRLLIPYLQPERYFAIEPNRWLIDDAVERELGHDIVCLKKPVFSERDDFDCGSLNATFHFIMAQSIVTHCGPDLFRRLMTSFASVLEPDGLVLLSYLNKPEPSSGLPGDGWHYPSSVSYTESQVQTFVTEAGLHGTAIPWHHPGASWYLAARSPSRLPTEGEKRFLAGAVLFDPQFVKSRQVQLATEGYPSSTAGVMPRP